MPNVCCVPGCRSTYVTANLFRFPKDDSLQHKWLRSIPRKNLKISENTKVCSDHFHPDQIIREDILCSDGLPVKRGRCALEKNAVPTNFSCLPEYLSSRVRTLRDDSEKTCLAIKKRLDAAEDTLLHKYTNFFDELSSNINRFSKYSWNISKQGLKIFLYKVDFSSNSPQISKSFSINTDLDAEIYICKNLVRNQELKSILGSEYKCNSFSKIENLIIYLENFDSDSVTVEEAVNSLCEKINGYIETGKIAVENIEATRFCIGHLKTTFNY